MDARGSTVVVDRHLSGNDRVESLRSDALAGLTGERKGMPPKWFYDATGSRVTSSNSRLPSAS